ncbi:MAG: hypothetical protein IJ514_02645 [Clostridia bacterium]|nr:hypothetical protein [Clostridia bacterium]
MKTRTRNFVILVATVLMFLVAALASVMLSTASASATAVELAMVSGASVRKDGTTPGIRFTYEITPATYEYIQTLTADNDVHYGIVIAKAEDVAEYPLTTANLFGDQAAYTNDPNDTTKPYFANIVGETLIAPSGDVTNYRFNGALAKVQDKNITQRFVGLGYVRVQAKEGENVTPTYYWAADNDNTRTAAQVAETYMASGGTDDTGAVMTYVRKAYSSLGMEAESSNKGTAESPFVINDDATYANFKTAYANGVLTGGSFCFQVSEAVDYTGIATDFAERTFTFTYEVGGTNVVENFASPATTAAAYHYYKGMTTGTGTDYPDAADPKDVQNETAVYHDEFAGRYGVISLKSSYYGNTQSNSESYFGWNYFIRKASSGSYQPADDNWDYCSMWIYIPDPDTSDDVYSVIATDIWSNTTEDTIVPYDTWTEVKRTKAKFSDNPTPSGFSSSAGSNKRACFIIEGVGAYTGAQADIYDAANNPTVYIDSISFEKETLTVTAERQTGSTVKINVAAKDGVSTVDNVAYSVRAIGFNDVSFPVKEGTFEAGLSANYLITVTATVGGVEASTTVSYIVTDANALASNEIEGFYSAASVAAAYGIAEGAAKASKTVPNETAQWHAEFEGRYGVIQLSQAHMDKYGANYYLCSMTRDANFYRYANDDSSTKDATTSDSWRDDTRWDYLSIWIYVAKPEGSTATQVELGGTYDSNTRMVDFDTWYEIQFDKTHCGQYFNRPYYTLASATSRNDNIMPLFILGAEADAGYTVYVDKISYEKNA